MRPHQGVESKKEEETTFEVTICIRLSLLCVCVCLITGLEWVTPERSMAHLSLLPAILRERLRLIDTVLVTPYE